MLKKFKFKNIIFVIACGLLSTNIHASIVSATATSNAILETLVSITNSESSRVNFGIIYVYSSTVGTVTLDPNTGAVSSTGGISIGTGSSRATFKLQGTAGQLINLSASGTNVTSGVNSIPTTYTLSASTINLSGSGEGSIRVGGTLTFNGNVVPGSYEGSVTVTANY